MYTYCRFGADSGILHSVRGFGINTYCYRPGKRARGRMEEQIDNPLRGLTMPPPPV